MKRCSKCGQRKPPRAFFSDRAECRSCWRARNAASRRWIREYAERWRRKNRCLVASAKAVADGPREFRLTKYHRRRHEAMLAYGGYRCRCCGETDPLFLTIDHVNNDGARHRRRVGFSSGFFRWLKDNGYPPGFQVLCSNCNHGRYRNGGVCPHKDPVGKGPSGS